LGRCKFGNWDDEDEPAQTTLSVLNVSYVVNERVGPWWKGACLRRIRHKLVLRDVCMHVRSGQMTGILGGSGTFLFNFSFHCLIIMFCKNESAKKSFRQVISTIVTVKIPLSRFKPKVMYTKIQHFK